MYFFDSYYVAYKLKKIIIRNKKNCVKNAVNVHSYLHGKFITSVTSIKDIVIQFEITIRSDGLLPDFT